jgi:PKD repeat protein
MKKLIPYIFVLLFCMSAVMAYNTVTFDYVNEAGNDVTNVAVFVFECTDSTCTDLADGYDRSDKAAYKYTGTSNSAELRTANVYSDTYYVAYAFGGVTSTYATLTDRYKVDAQIYSFSGSNQDAGTYELELIQAEDCTSEIQTFSVTNAGNIDEEVTFDATIESAFTDDNEVYYWGDADSQYDDWYISDITVSLDVTLDGTSEHTDSTDVEIMMDETEDISFGFTPTEVGTYTATITTSVGDAQCANDIEDSESVEFDIEEESEGYSPVIVSCEADPNPVEVGQSTQFDVTLDVLTYIRIYLVNYQVSYSWDFGDGTSSTQEEPTHTYSTAGTYTATVTATDADGNFDTCTVTVLVEEPNQGPEVSCDPFDGGNADLGDAMTLEVDATDSDGTIVSYDWDFGDGTSTTTTSSSIDHTYTSAETFDVVVIVTDNDGATAQCTGEATISNDAPEVDCSILPTTAIVNEVTDLEVSATDSDGTVVQYDWDFDDGNVDSTTVDSTTHTYTAIGYYTIVVQVTDDQGDTAQCSQDIEVLPDNYGPAVSCDFDPTTTTVGAEVTLSVTAQDTDGTIVQYEWDFLGDGSVDETTTVDSVTTTFSTEGTFPNLVLVTDDDGAQAICVGAVIVGPANVAPEAVCNGPYTGTVGEDVTFSAAGSSDSDGTIVQYDWDFGDSTGQITTSEDTDYAYSSAGEYTVTLTVTDDSGDTDSCTTTATIEESNIGPTLDCSALPTSGIEGLPLELEVTATDSDGTIASYTWDFGDGDADQTVVGETEHTYTTDGTFTLVVIATDNDGDTATCSQDIAIEDDVPAVAVASATPSSGEPRLKVQFSSEGSSGNLPLTYKWSFGDGSGTSTEAHPRHTYNEEGVYTAVLLVTDADGDTDTDTVIITVKKEEPTNNARNHYLIDGIALGNDGIVTAGDTLELYISTENIAGIDKRNVAFNAIIQELGVYATSSELDIDNGEKEAVMLLLDIPEDTQEGMYFVRITVSDDDVKRVIYRDIIVE